MEWDYKFPPWDLAELEQNAEPNMAALGGPSCSSLGGQPDVMDCSVDLKLGGLGNPEPPEKWKDQPTVPTPASFSSPSKRARAPSTAGQNASCSVDGCKSDLSNCREYHRRHKVCEVHSKTPIVLVGGLEQRFCQQCSRFHLLVEFDEVKRSCRKRLDGHNRRRRKPQPESINSTSLFPVQRGTRFSTYAHISQTPPTESNWAGIVKTEEDALYTHHSPLQYIDSQLQVSAPLFCNYKDGKQFPFLQDGKDAFSRSAIEPSMCQPLLKTTVSSVASTSNKIISDGLTQVFDADCALSLLSSPTQTSGINVGQMLPANRIPMAQPLDSSLRYGSLNPYSGSQASGNVLATGFSCSGGVEDEQVGGVVVSDADADLSCQGLFHVGGEGSSDGASQSLPFTWQ